MHIIFILNFIPDFEMGVLLKLHSGLNWAVCGEPLLGAF